MTRAHLLAELRELQTARTHVIECLAGEAVDRDAYVREVLEQAYQRLELRCRELARRVAALRDEAQA